LIRDPITNPRNDSNPINYNYYNSLKNNSKYVSSFTEGNNQSQKDQNNNNSNLHNKNSELISSLKLKNFNEIERTDSSTYPKTNYNYNDIFQVQSNNLNKEVAYNKVNNMTIS
jgi:hypothetical protein